ncbi:MAG: AzlC family ABC transporter permease [Rhodoblastus sp.]|nr:MAG: AzlC family ABC transporter permease [Rhodoblastus sp.]
MNETTTIAEPIGPTLAGMALGARMAAPFAPGLIVFALANGALSAQTGLSFAETFGMSGVMFAGGAQAMATQMWPHGAWSLSTTLTMIGVVAAVNSRMFLMGASLRPWLSQAPASLIYPNLALLTDLNWSIGVSHRANGGSDIGVVLGAGLLSWIVWTPICMLGWALTGLVTDPRRYALDLMMVVVFSAMSINVFKRARSASPFVVSGAAALAASWLIGGFWFIVIGAVAGAGWAALRGGDA